VFAEFGSNRGGFETRVKASRGGHVSITTQVNKRSGQDAFRFLGFFPVAEGAGRFVAGEGTNIFTRG
jgi:hypothetical protein